MKNDKIKVKSWNWKIRIKKISPFCFGFNTDLGSESSILNFLLSKKIKKLKLKNETLKYHICFIFNSYLH